MIPRKLESKLRELAGYYPVVVVTGPRQSGKTTLCQATFPDRPYVSLEALDAREFARGDPRGFLAEYGDGAIFDEIQHVPGLLNYLQGEVDARPDPGRFVLTGSQHFGLSQSIAQSLAGRAAFSCCCHPAWRNCVPFQPLRSTCIRCSGKARIPASMTATSPLTGGWRTTRPPTIQRDVREVINVGDLQVFSGFLKLCAGRTAQEINLSTLGGDAGVSHNTVRAWLSVLETSYIIHRLPAWHLNIRKQVVKAPKLHFFDSGLACYLLGIREPEQLRLHPLRGAIFESWVIAEIYKAYVHRGYSRVCFTIGKPVGLKSISSSIRANGWRPSRSNRERQRPRIFSRIFSACLIDWERRANHAGLETTWCTAALIPSNAHRRGSYPGVMCNRYPPKDKVQIIVDESYSKLARGE